MSSDKPVRVPSFRGATGWINSEPLDPDALKGQVVLVHFGTFTCINWIRTLPHVRSWASTYSGEGLTVVGVNTPEFHFERDFASVEREIQKRAIHYPVAVDNEYRVWDAFDNRYWPALYLADRDGTIRYRHFGEGRYEETERVLQRLLGVDRQLVSIEGKGDEAAAEWDTLKSPETYFSLDRSVGFVESSSDRLRLNEWTLQGEWKRNSEGAELGDGTGSMFFRFHARDLNLVMGASELGRSLRFQVLISGQSPGGSGGGDVGTDGGGEVSEKRMYQLIRQPGEVEDEVFEISFPDPGVELYVATFG